MRMKKLYFRVDCGKHIGNGHLMRCQVIANEFVANGWEVCFLTRAQPGSDGPAIPYQLKNIGAGALSSNVKDDDYRTWLGVSDVEEFEAIDNIVEDCSLIFIDHYGITCETEKLLALAGHKVIVLDEVLREHYCHIFFDYFSNADRKKLESLQHFPHVQIYNGGKYTPLSRRFTASKKQINSKTIKNILLNLGSVKEDMYLKVLTALSEVKGYSLNVKVLSSYRLPNTFPGIEVENQSFTNRLELLNLEADFVIGSSGVAMFERIAQGVPCVNGIVVDNQESGSTHFQDDDIHFFGLDFRSVECSELALYFERVFKTYLAKSQQECECDFKGNGAREIYDAINSSFDTCEEQKGSCS